MRTLLALLLLAAIVKVMADPISNLQSAAAAAVVHSQPVVANAAAASVSQNGNGNVTPAQQSDFRQAVFSFLRAKGRFEPKDEYCSQFVDQTDCQAHFACCGCRWFDDFFLCNT